MAQNYPYTTSELNIIHPDMHVCTNVRVCARTHTHTHTHTQTLLPLIFL